MNDRPPAKDEQTRGRMQRQARRGTGPEIVVRSVLADLGHRYRLEPKGLPARPDIANVRRGWAIFVHGCFWHHHAECRRATIPSHNRDWWKAKLEGNRQRDARQVTALTQLGFRVLVVWECETRSKVALRQRLVEWFEHAGPGQ